MHEKSLGIPLYTLIYYKDVDSFEGLSVDQIEYFQENYEPDVLSRMKKALKWASETPDYDFQSVIPDQEPMPTNQQLHRFLTLYHRSMECISEDD